VKIGANDFGALFASGRDAVLDPDAVLSADRIAVPAGASRKVHGALVMTVSAPPIASAD
jgi:hypothetical protein